MLSISTTFQPLKNISARIRYRTSPLAGNGCEGFKQFLSAFFTAFPDMHTNIEHIVIENIPWFDPWQASVSFS